MSLQDPRHRASAARRPRAAVGSLKKRAVASEEDEAGERRHHEHVGDPDVLAHRERDDGPDRPPMFTSV